MANKMIIDASHPEETRVVVLKGNRVEEFDFEAASKKPLRGNIYLAKVTRVEPSLQAAFVDYGGNRHGFLAFSEIHPDYYQIPVADRQALLEEEARSHQEDEDEPNGDRRSRRHRRPRGQETQPQEAQSRAEPAETISEDAFRNDGGGFAAAAAPDPVERAEEAAMTEAALDAEPPLVASEGEAETSSEERDAEDETEHEAARVEHAAETAHYSEEAEPSYGHIETVETHHEEDDEPEVTTLGGSGSDETEMRAPRPRGGDYEGEPVEVIGGDALDEAPRRPQRARRHYKIQEVIKRRQVMLVQVVKEERGNKGAALTTYLSLAGRYSVLMPNTARGGGISRKITNAQDRSRLKAIAEDLEVPEGMGVILRTAGASRTKQEVKRDFEYLLRMWETVRETTLSSTAPTLVYEEGSLIKRAIRDLYGKDIDEITVAGEAAYREARAFMRLLMPTHVKCVVPYRDTQPLFAKAGVEAQLDAMFSNQVTLKSGGYIVINQTEALVAIDVNSGRSTREHNIEDTAARTNLEAADEIAHQLRLRDLAGLIVVDFIDMEEPRNNRAVERRMKDALKNDRARIQVGRISHFGLLEMSRQRIRTGVLEGSTVQCPHCMGAGVVRSTSSIALFVLRVLEDALIRSSTHDMIVRTRTPVALYILNQKRAHLRDLERRFGVIITVENDDSLSGSNYHALERGELASGTRVLDPEFESRPAGLVAAPDEDDYAGEEAPEAEDEVEAVEAAAVEDEGEAGESEAETEGERGEGEISAEESERRRRRRRRRRRGGAERSPATEMVATDSPQPADDGLAVVAEIGGDFSVQTNNGEAEEGRANGSRRRRSRRGRRGERFGAPTAEGSSEDLNAGEDFEAEGAVLDAEGHPPAEGEAEPEPALEQPELPWHLPLAEQPELEPGSDAPEALAPLSEPVTAEGPDLEEPEEEVAAPEATAEAAPVTSEVEQPEPAPPEPAAPVVEEPPRPRRSGWWQRAKASISE
jgi:ribonuclease E